MRRLLILVFLIFLMAAGPALAFPPVDRNSLGLGENDDVSFGSLSVGTSISATGTEYTVWEIQDSNGDVVAACTVECSVITDGSQVCQIHYYVMSDTPGTLTEELTIDVDSD
jgi:hypothetical protein